MRLHHLLILSSILFAQLSQAAYVEKVKGKKILIFLDGMSVSKGDMVETIDPTSKKKTAILRVTTVKDDKAIAELVRGKAKINQTVYGRAAGKSIKSPKEMPTTKKYVKKSTVANHNSTFAIGGMLGVGFDTMELKLPYPTPTETVETTGMGFSLMAVADMKLNDWFSVRALAGMEQFNVKGDSVDGGSGGYCVTCETEITYFKGAAWGKVSLFSSVWAGLGFGLQHPLSKKTNALDEASIKSEVVYMFGGGADVELTDNMYIPLQIEYGMTPSSDFANSTYYGVRAGVMLRY